MHCHVLTHTVDGMMGAQLKVAPGALALALPSGKPCPSGTTTPSGQDVIIKVEDFQFNPKNAMASAGQTVTWEWQADDHSTTSDYGIWDSGVQNKPHSFSHTFTTADAGRAFRYFCSQHGGPGGAGMSGTIMVM